MNRAATNGTDQSRASARASAGPDAPAVAGATAPAALSCRRRNNSISSPPRYRLNALDIFDYEEEVDPDTGFQTGYCDVYERHEDQDGRQWREHSDGLLELVDRTSTAERKAAFQLRGNIECFIKYFRREHVAFWTIVPGEPIHPKEFGRRWNSFLANEGSWIRGFLRVLEPHLDGKPHYHALIAVDWDLEPDKFDWPAYYLAKRLYNPSRRKGQQSAEFYRWRQQYIASVPARTRNLWARLRKVLKNYGLGMWTEFVPLRREAAQVAEYIGKYLEAGLKLRRHEWKGCRRVETDRRSARQWKRYGRLFSWVTPRAMAWRQRVGRMVQVVGARDFEGLAARLGKRWAYHHRDKIIHLDEEDFAAWLRRLGALWRPPRQVRRDASRAPLWWLRANPAHPIAKRILAARQSATSTQPYRWPSGCESTS